MEIKLSNKAYVRINTTDIKHTFDESLKNVGILSYINGHFATNTCIV